MSDTTGGDHVSVSGSASYDRVDCATFENSGKATVTGLLRADRVDSSGKLRAGSLDAGSVDVRKKLVVEGDATVEDLDSSGKTVVRGDARADELDGSGKTVVRGDASIDRLDGSGKTSVDGNFDGQEVDTSGTLDVDGNASVDRLDGSGKTSVDGNFDGHEIETSGKLAVGGSLVAANVDVSGNLRVDGLTDVTDLVVDGAGTFEDVNADALTATGSLRAGDVAARRFELTLGDESRVDSVRATEVVVRAGERGRSLVTKLLGRDDAVLAVDTVEGETVDLDVTDAETVVGDRVTLGPDASVGVVYSDDVDAAPDADVGDVKSRDAY
ncbi:hypothetical protein [Halobacterium bonnevillei]|uniref:Polymer-forming cytoskeletal protein n=1 Tax=Halobacterium bonnevillei TaxID=2692200 RepID=A0A6B0SR04_9EURY|nr:hypothetical protein [Halobacterium bonnevillei]MXR21981.1 hypothetical protein [Halobacterium bonnevillei]